MKKRIVLPLVVVISFLLCFPGVHLVSAAGGLTRSDAVSWARAQNGRTGNCDVDGNGLWCTDLATAYMNYLWLKTNNDNRDPWGLYPYTTKMAYAYDNYVSGNNNWTVIERNSSTVPLPGDIFVSEQDTLGQGYGHVGIVLTPYGSTRAEIIEMSGGVRPTISTITWGSQTSYNPQHFIRFNYFLPDPNPTVAFSNWESPGKTYIGATDASIGQNVSVSSGSWTGVGMILYDNSGKELGRAGDTPTAGISQYYYRINEELKVKLTPETTYKYRFYADVSGTRYYSDVKSFKTLPLYVTFSSWESDGRTYIRETDASIGQRVDVSGGSWTGVGMILYDNNRNELGRAGDTPTAGIPQYYYKINEELHVTLKHATTYQYRFYAVVDGNTYYSDYKSFKTNGSHTWDSGKVTTEPTTTSEGVKTFTCTQCGSTRTEKIDKLTPATHSHTMVKTPGVAATCTKNGNIEYWTCTGCGKYFYEEAGINEINNLQNTIIKAKNHDFSGNAQYCRNGCGTKNPNYQENIPEGTTNISNWRVSGIKDLVYTGDILKQERILVFHNGEYATVKVRYRNNVDVGTATVTITGTGEYYGQIVKYFNITKANNPLKIKVSKKTYKQLNLKKAKSFKIGASKALGAVTYTLNKKAKKAKIKVTAKGKVTIPKNCKPGTYKITVKASGNKNYKAGSKTVTVKVK